jgi:probable rRNA maturation factor
MTGRPHIEVDIRAAADAWAALDDVEPLSRRVMDACARLTGATGEVAVLLTDDAEMRELNRRWRGKDRPTDVLSFPSRAPGADGDMPFLGDVAISHGVAARDAAVLGRPFTAHFAHLLAHGVLHLLGHDHETEADAARMEPLEVKILAEVGLPDPYAAEEEDVLQP